MSLNGHNNSNVTKFAGDGFINHDVTEDVTSPAVYYVVASMLTFTCFVGTFFNGVAIFVFAKNKHLRTPTNSFVMSLCACDLLMCLIGMPIPAVYAWGKTTIDNHAICVFDGFTVYFLGLSSMYLLAAISVDRYVVIVRPMASTMVTQRVASLAIGVCFLMGLFWTMMPLLGWNHYVPEGIRVACSISWESGDSAAASYVFAIFVFCLLLPMTIMVFCYANIYRARGLSGPDVGIGR
ncbi:pinopsin-like [Littorina saxatilis]|uniref:pinopsin-like n=1 Tax=Littorina saxatilis TaxID=31220 RepID=UPI0038B45BDB